MFDWRIVSKNVDLLKQKDDYPCKYMGSFKRFSEEKCFYRSVNDGTANNNGKKLDGHISNEDNSTCKKNWDKFDIKKTGKWVTLLWIGLSKSFVCLYH